MAKFEITSPDGRKFEVTAPDGAGQDDVLAYAQQQFSAPEEPEQQGRSYADIARDVGVTAVKGAVGLPQAFVGLADIPTGGRVGRALDSVGVRFDDAQKILDSQYSQQTQADKKYVNEADGFFDTIGRAVERPSTIATAVGESLPSMIGGAGIARGLLKAAPKLAPVVAGAIGEGAIGAGSAAEQIRGESKDGLLTAGQSAAAVASGVGTGILGFAGGKLAQKLGLGDIDTILASGTGQASAKGFVKQVVGSGISEGVFEEMPQSAQEQMWQNYATDKPIMEGVGNASAMGMLAGTAMGGAGGGYNAAIGGRQRADAAPADAPAGAAAADVLGTPEPAQAAPTEAEKALYTPKTLTALDRVTEIDAKLPAAAAEEASALQVERDSITASWPKATPGLQTSFTTEAGARLDGQYALIESGDLTTSHDENLRPVATYPAELQPRERERHASEMQIQQIVGRLDPARLGESADVATGAPIVGADGLVESGNARTIALKRVYQANGQKALDYKQFIKDNAGRFGITPESVDAMQKPVLVRVRNTPVNRAEFARQANQSTVARMSPSEQARSDAAQIDSMDDLNPTEAGDFSSGTSSGFIQRFMAKLPATEQAGLIDSTGQLSQAGYTRIRNAVLAKAYGDSPVLQRMVESLDNNVRNIGAALLRVAPQVAKTREAINDGALHDADLTPDLMAAAEELSALKEKGTSVTEALAQAGMFGDKLTAESRELLAFMDANIRSPRRIAEFIQSYLDALTAAGNPAQGSMFGDTAAPAKTDLLTAARRATNGETTTGGADAGNTATAQEDRGQPAGTPRAETGIGGNEIPTGEWVEFPRDSGTLGIPRAEMPQVKGEHRGALIQFLGGLGITHETVDMPASELKPTQAEFSKKKAAGWQDVQEGVDRSVLASSDGYILDGHHQWVSALANGETEKVIRFSAPIKELLAATYRFPSVKRSEGSNIVELRAKSRQDFKDALADLAQIATKHTRAAMLPEDTPNLMPTLIKLSSAAIAEVGYQAKDIIAHVKKALHANPTFKAFWNKVGNALYRKAAEQAAAEQSRQRVDDLFAMVEERQGQQDLFAQPAEKVGADRPFDLKRDNYTPPKPSDYIDAALVARVDQFIKDNHVPLGDPKISAADWQRAEALLTPVLANAEQNFAPYIKEIAKLTRDSGAMGFMIGPLKQMDRSVIKLAGEYGFDIGQLRDVLRSTVVVSTYDEAQRVVDAIYKNFKVIPGRVKNRTSAKIAALDLDERATPLKSGYMDVLVNVEFAGGQAEIQINVPEMIGAKLAQGHKLYEIERDADRGSELKTAADAMQLEFYGAAAGANRLAAAAAPSKKKASLEKSPLAGNDLTSLKSPASDKINTLPSGNRTKSSPLDDATKSQPAGNLSGTFISNTSTTNIAQTDNQAYTENGKTAGEDDGQSDGNNNPGGTQGKGAGPASADDGSGDVARVRGGPGRGNKRADSNARDETGDQAGGVQDAGTAAGRKGGNPQHGGQDGNGNRAGRNAAIPAGRDIPAKSGRNYAFGDGDLTYAGG